MALALETPDPPPGDDHRFAGVGTDGGKMNFAQVHRCLHIPRSLLRLWDFSADMQLKAIVPDQRTCPTLLWQIKWQNKRFPPLPIGKMIRPFSLLTA